MKLSSIMLLRSAIHYLISVIEVLNLIDEDDYIELVKKCRTKKEKIKSICDNAERGSAWMALFFTLELLDEVVDETPLPDQ